MWCRGKRWPIQAGKSDTSMNDGRGQLQHESTPTRPSARHPARARPGADGVLSRLPGVRDGNGQVETNDQDVLSQALQTLALLGSRVKPPQHSARAHGLLRRRPRATALVAIFLVTFLLPCCAPLLPLLRLGSVALDAENHVGQIEAIFSAGGAAVFNPQKLQAARSEVESVTRDLHEINGALNLAGAPLAAVSPTLRNYRLL